MSGEIIIATWPKNSREQLRVRIDSYKGQAIVDCRAWYTGTDGSLRPGKGGLTLAVRHLPQLADAIVRALASATASGLLNGEG